MNVRLTLYVLGGLLIFLGAALLLPIPFSIWYHDGQLLTFVLSAAITSLVGGFLFWRFRREREEITLREGFAVVTFAWIGFALFGSLPYIISASLTNPVNAFFESMSGFTTAGASVFTDVEAVPKSVLFWRALTQWMGGMGFIVLGVAILPLLGVGGMQLYEAEAPGPTAERLTPRIQDTARLLWGVYALLTGLGLALFWLGEMDFFDALCHTFTAVATGGFSTRNASFAAFSSYSQMVALVLMLLGGVNFSLHYYALKGRARNYWASSEFRFYLGVLGGATLVVFLANLALGGNWLANLRNSAFTVTSILTTSGFTTADYEAWPFLCQAVLITLMFAGGCAGSTSGGVKQVRLLLLFKHALLQLRALVHPRQVRILKLDHRPVPQDVMQDILGFVILFVGFLVLATLLLAAVGMDLITAGSAVIACMSNVGPALGEVGPSKNYAALPAFAKVVLSFAMLLGRLEVSTVLVIFFGSLWRK